MDPETEKTIKEQISQLPNEVRKLFTDPKLNDKFVIIGKKYGLNIEQLGIFQMETMLMMLGLTHLDDYPQELKSRLAMKEERVDNIITDVNQEILTGMRQKLKEAYDKTNLEEEESSVEETQNLHSAGIPKHSANAGATGQVKILPDIPELPKPAGGIIAQKLSGDFHLPSQKTEYSVPNVTKDEEKPVPQKPATDPYREAIE